MSPRYGNAPEAGVAPEASEQGVLPGRRDQQRGGAHASITPSHNSRHSLTIPVHSVPLARQRALISVGLCALRTGRGGLVHQVYRALVRESLADV
jgi:hypothetical protein